MPFAGREEGLPNGTLLLYPTLLHFAEERE